MRRFLLPKWMRRALLILTSSFAIFLLTDLLFMVLVPIGYPGQLSRPIEKSFSHSRVDQTNLIQRAVQDQESTIQNREVELSITPSDISARFDLDIPASSPLAQIITEASINGDIPSIVTAAFGEIQKSSLEDETIFDAKDFGSPTWTMDSKTQIMHVTIEAQKNTSNQYLILEIKPARISANNLARDQVKVTIDGLRFAKVEPLTGMDVTSNQMTVEAINQSLGPISVTVLPNPNSIANAEIRTLSTTRRQFLQTLGDWLSFPFVSDILYSIVEVAPLLIFLFIIKNATRIHKLYIVPVFVRAIEALLVFHFTVAFINGWANLFNTGLINSRLSDAVYTVITNYYRVFVTPIIRTGPSDFGVVVFGLFLPAVLFDWWKNKESRTKRRTALKPFLLEIILILPFLFGLATWVALFMRQQGYISLPRISFGNVPLWIWMLFYASSICLIILWLMKKLEGSLISTDHRAARILSVWALILTGVIQATRYESNLSAALPSWVIWLPISTVLGAVLIVSFASIVTGALRNLFPKFELPGSRTQWWIAAIIIAIPLRGLVNKSSPIAYQYDIFGLVFSLDNLIIFIWLTGMTWILYRRGRRSLHIDSFTRQIGILLAASVLFSITSRWFYIPLTFLLGWLLLNWIVQPADYWNSLKPLHNRVVKRRNELFEKIINLNSAESAHWEYRKKMSDKLAEGKITPNGFDRELKKRRTQLDTLQSTSKIDGQTPKDVALAFGPFDSAWENALHASKWAAIFALPWLFLYLRDFLAGITFSEAFPLFDFLTDVLYILCRWVGIGFFFGYFYPYIRGRTGIQKGVSLFVVLFVASLPIAAIYRVTISSWQGTLFWGLQVFIECLLLGLIAFDYWTLRIGKRSWQMLFEVEGLTSVGISVSTIVAAISATVIALLTSQATNLVSLSLKFLLPDLPVDFLPE